MPVRIWHNPRCSKSRQTLQILHDQGIQPEVVNYLETPPSAEELDSVLTSLGLEPRELMRQGEQEYKSLHLDDAGLTRQQLIAAMVEHPILIQRPIVMAGDKIVIGRPPEKVREVL